MSAIGGVVDFRNGNVGFSELNAIKNAQALRGRDSSVEFFDSGVGMFYNSDGIFECEQPIISERSGYNTVLAIDAPFFDGKAAIEAYLTYGVEFLGMLALPFAVALYDSKRRMLLLARDKNGKKPLFYRLKSGKVLFSSEPKGILAIDDKESRAVRVNKEVLSEHLTSPVGVYSAADIYSDIFEVRRGECILFSELGVSRFFYRGSTHRQIKSRIGEGAKGRSLEPLPDICESDVIASLEDALIAFDIPQFDVSMPSLCRLFSSVRDGSVFRFDDYIKKENLLYSYEREDRLSAFYGKIGFGTIVPPDRYEGLRIKYEEEKKRSFEILAELFLSLERNEILFLRSIMGDLKLNLILKRLDKESVKKENTEQMVRTLGMLYQAAKWSKLRRIEFVGM